MAADGCTLGCTALQAIIHCFKAAVALKSTMPTAMTLVLYKPLLRDCGVTVTATEVG